MDNDEARRLIDDRLRVGGKAFAPLTGDFILAQDGSYIGE